MIRFWVRHRSWDALTVTLPCKLQCLLFKRTGSYCAHTQLRAFWLCCNNTQDLFCIQIVQRLSGSIHPPASSCILVCVSACRFHIGSTFNYSTLTKYCLITRYLVPLKPRSWHRKVISTGMHECAKLSKKKKELVRTEHIQLCPLGGS